MMALGLQGQQISRVLHSRSLLGSSRSLFNVTGPLFALERVNGPPVLLRIKGLYSVARDDVESSTFNVGEPNGHNSVNKDETSYIRDIISTM